MNVKILISYHKRDILFKDDILTPIHVGRSLALKTAPLYDKNIKWMLDNMIGDDTGDNISEKNASYNEMTAVYWAWKNYDKVGNPDYIGFMHYRRHFVFREIKEVYCECSDSSNGYFDLINYSPEHLHNILAGCDFVCAKPYMIDSVYKHYESSHKIEDLDLALLILAEKYPEYEQVAQRYIHGHKAYFCNMFIMPRKMFFGYAKWMFDILGEFENRTNTVDKRFFISERLTGIFIASLLEKGYKGQFFPTMFIEEETRIPVVLATDENYAVPTCVAMTSMLVNAKHTTHYDFHLLVPGRFSEASKNSLQSLKNDFPNCDINFVDMKDRFSDIKMKIGHITSATYYRLLLGEILPQQSKCIYLDSDVVVNEDLAGLFRTNIDDFYVAGVKAPDYHFKGQRSRAHCDETGLPSTDQYINAGVLLLNLKKIRLDGLTEKFLDLSARGFSSQDQDVINVSCYGNIRHLHFRYNYMISKYVSKRRSLRKVFTDREIEEANSGPAIVHYCDRVKPWQSPSCYLGEQWWDYAKRSPVYDDALLKYGPLMIESGYAMLESRAASVGGLPRPFPFSAGAAVTYLRRNAKSFFRCWRDNGLKYTVFATAHEVRSVLGRE